MTVPDRRPRLVTVVLVLMVGSGGCAAAVGLLTADRPAVGVPLIAWGLAQAAVAGALGAGRRWSRTAGVAMAVLQLVGALSVLAGGPAVADEAAGIGALLGVLLLLGWCSPHVGEFVQRSGPQRAAAVRDDGPSPACPAEAERL